MATFTPFEYQQLMARASQRAQKEPVAKVGVAIEGSLHDDIIDECNRRGWLFFHGSMAHRTHRTKGEPDFIILAENGRTLLVECKSRTGKSSTAQLGIQAHARKLGHVVHVVRSIEEFKQICA